MAQDKAVAAQKTALADQLQRGLALHRAGQLEQAEGLYRSVLKRQPENVDALNLLGLVMQARGHSFDALALFDRAVAAGPQSPVARYNRGTALMQVGRALDAAEAFRQAIALRPGYADAYLNLGAALHYQGDLDAATVSFEQMCTHFPGDARAHFNLARCLAETKQELPRAVVAAQTVVTLDPNNAEGWILLAGLQAQTDQIEAAVQSAGRAIALSPRNPDYHNRLGLWFTQLGRHEAAHAAHAEACRLAPTKPEVFYNFGNSLHAAAKYVEAARQYQAAIALKPDYADAYSNLAEALRSAEDFEGAFAALDRCLALNPAHATALKSKAVVFAAQALTLARAGRWQEADDKYARACMLDPAREEFVTDRINNLVNNSQFDAALGIQREVLAVKPDDLEAQTMHAFALLTAGRFEEGWKRLRVQRLAYSTTKKRADESVVPLWDGEDITHSKVIASAEYGLGDEILMASMLPDLVARAQAATFTCSSRLLRLLRRSFQGIEFVDYHQIPELHLASYGYQMTFSELGRLFRRTSDEFPHRRAFLSAEPARTAELKAKYAGRVGRPVVGLSWSSARPKIGRLKEVGLNELIAVTGSDVEAVNLQYLSDPSQIDRLMAKTGARITTDATVDPMGDLDDYAPQIAAMDLVITISNTAAHLSGALGVPTILLLPAGHARLWYWQRAFDRCLWYPTITYASQGPDASWQAALEYCRGRIEQLVDQRRRDAR